MTATLAMRFALGGLVALLTAVGGSHDARAASPGPATSPGPMLGPEEPAPPPSGAPGAPPSPPGAVPATAPPVALSDHDQVIGHLGIEARQIAGSPYPLALHPNGCAAVAPPPPSGTTATTCTVEMGAVGVRYWKTRNLAWNVALALAAGSGRQGSQELDTYFGTGPIVGMTLLLGNWRHLAIGASPEASLIYFRPGGGGPGTKLVGFRAQLEGELHFGFVDVPALSVGIATGLLFQYESAPGVSTWSVSVGDARSVWGTLSNLFIRYYL